MMKMSSFEEIYIWVREEREKRNMYSNTCYMYHTFTPLYLINLKWWLHNIHTALS
ncbi:hypothetical protein Hanom_Chr10g00900661 [Helianthus anomalus]